MKNKVNSLLTEILALHLEREEMVPVLEDPRKETLIRSEIFRKFAIIDALLSSRDLDATSSKKSLMDLVSLSKKVTNAEGDDLKVMAILGPEGRAAVGANENEHDQFVNYMELPPEVREKILGNLTSAADKLAISDAIPEDFAMMENWEDRTTLKFEVTFPSRMERREFGWQELLNLGRSNNHIRNVILEHFITTLDTFSSSQGICAKVRDIYKEISGPKGAQILNPIPFIVYVGLSSSYDENSTFRKLNMLGRSILYCSTFVSGTSALETFQKLKELLLRIPNVRRLLVVIRVGVDAWHGEDLDSELLENPPLPDLPFLESICMKYETDYGNYGQSEDVLSKILEKYGQGLRCLRINSFFPELIPAVNISLPTNLSFLEIWHERAMDAGIEDWLQFLDACVGSPLKIIKLTGMSVHDVDGTLLPRLMSTLSKFSGTLEELLIKLNKPGQKDAGTSRLLHLADVDLPHLKIATIECWPGTPAFLFQCPSLEKLTIMVNWEVNVENIKSYLEAAGISYLPANRKSVPQANIWKVLPSLQMLTLLRKVSFCCNKADLIYDVTRSDCLAVQ